jgi:hypothetical protein
LGGGLLGGGLLDGGLLGGGLLGGGGLLPRTLSAHSQRSASVR